jgi:hypothetical protein
MAVVRANFPPHKYPFIRFLSCVEKVTKEVLQDIGTELPSSALAASSELSLALAGRVHSADNRTR